MNFVLWPTQRMGREIKFLKCKQMRSSNTQINERRWESRGGKWEFRAICCCWCWWSRARKIRRHVDHIFYAIQPKSYHLIHVVSKFFDCVFDHRSHREPNFWTRIQLARARELDKWETNEEKKNGKCWSRSSLSWKVKWNENYTFFRAKTKKKPDTSMIGSWGTPHESSSVKWWGKTNRELNLNKFLNFSKVELFCFPPKLLQHSFTFHTQFNYRASGGIYNWTLLSPRLTAIAAFNQTRQPLDDFRRPARVSIIFLVIFYCLFAHCEEVTEKVNFISFTSRYENNKYHKYFTPNSEIID